MEGGGGHRNHLPRGLYVSARGGPEYDKLLASELAISIVRTRLTFPKCVRTTLRKVAQHWRKRSQQEQPNDTSFKQGCSHYHYNDVMIMIMKDFV